MRVSTVNVHVESGTEFRGETLPSGTWTLDIRDNVGRRVSVFFDQDHKERATKLREMRAVIDAHLADLEPGNSADAQA